MTAQSPRLGELRRALDRSEPDEVAGVLAQFWSDISSPLVEEPDGTQSLVTFLWRDEDAHEVHLAVNRVSRTADESSMTRMPGTDVWHRSFLLPDDWRGSYTLLPLDAAGARRLRAMEPRWAMRTIRDEGERDPLNRLSTDMYSARPASVAQLPGAPDHGWLTRPARDVGSTDAHVGPGGRRLWLHRPPGDRDTARGLLIVLDGQVWHRAGHVAHAVDLLAERRIAPNVVFVDTSSDRAAALAPESTLPDWIVTDLLRWTSERVALDDSAVLVAGESLGGLTALRTAFAHPDRIAGVLSQSAALAQRPLHAQLPSATPAVRLLVGSLEDVALPAHRQLASAFAATGGRLHYEEYRGGHDMACWRGSWLEGIDWLLP